MRIREFSELTGIGADTLRYYEKEGLLHPARDANGYRTYGERDAAWAVFILRLKETRMPIAQIREYSRLRHLGDETLVARYEMLLAHQTCLRDWQRRLTEHQAHLEEKLRIYRKRLQQRKATLG